VRNGIFVLIFFTFRYELDCEAEQSAQQERAREGWFTANAIGQQPGETESRYLNRDDEYEIDVLISGECHGIQRQSIKNEGVCDPAERPDQQTNEYHRAMENLHDRFPFVQHR